MAREKKIIVVAGPTASGKSDFAVALAKKENGEIISADSRQVYKGLDIGTGKITREEMQGIPHHMIDVVNPGEPFTVIDYKEMAEPIIEDIFSRGKTPIICGGTGLYIDALMYDTKLPAVKPNPKLREELEKKSLEDLFEELQKKDPIRASTIDRNNKVRLVRALEILSELQTVPLQKQPHARFATELYLLEPTREELRKRVTARMEKRLAHGMINEVEQLVDQGFSSDEMKRFGLEYVSIAAMLEGKKTLEEMKEELVQKTMQYARRQTTWNKKYRDFARVVSLTNI